MATVGGWMKEKNERVKIPPRYFWTFSLVECLSKCAAECLGVFAEDLYRSGDVLKRKCGFPDLANFGEDKNGETVDNSSVTDWITSDDLKTQEEYQYVNLTREDWIRLGDLKTEDDFSDADPETGLQQEEEPDFCRQGCVKEDGEK
ncbi:hypothetical protein Bbelb_385490 [Branchiostoma belcheri]|nr:hypothetical protein Bbelb_385490 [Branchiostoma belcheri]